MKITKLLVLGVLALCGANSAWAVDGNVWTKPAFPSVPEVTTFTTYEAGKEVYLYNVVTLDKVCNLLGLVDAHHYL